MQIQKKAVALPTMKDFPLKLKFETTTKLRLLAACFLGLFYRSRLNARATIVFSF